MKSGPFFTILVALLVIATAGYWYGGRFLSNRHTVARFTYRITPTGVSSLRDDVIRTGLRAAMEANKIDPLLWIAMPLQEAESSGGASLGTSQSPPALIILSNRINRS